eukprot:GHVO01046243.1.p1 GENE.GHVO01046243.1~~GHVO01046243.1.p1  ORF type:complete len:147 (+),score=14.31 GHVO01046243.1:96-536(+)
MQNSLLEGPRHHFSIGRTSVLNGRGCRRTGRRSRPDYIRQYPNIRNGDQRQRYKKDFNAEYEEYRQLHAKIDQVSNMFRTLVEKIQGEEKGSEGYENMKNHIFMEYSQVKKDPKYLEQRKRCDYLYKKLGHIKKQITEFDLLTPVS